jgi:hypothetical protein
LTRWIVEHFWAPVGSGVQPVEETRFLAEYLFSGAEGGAAARKIDTTIAALPGFADTSFLTDWIAAHASVGARPAPADLTPNRASP